MENYESALRNFGIFQLLVAVGFFINCFLSANYFYYLLNLLLGDLSKNFDLIVLGLEVGYSLVFGVIALMMGIFMIKGKRDFYKMFVAVAGITIGLGVGFLVVKYFLQLSMAYSVYIYFLIIVYYIIALFYLKKDKIFVID